MSYLLNLFKLEKTLQKNSNLKQNAGKIRRYLIDQMVKNLSNFLEKYSLKFGRYSLSFGNLKLFFYSFEGPLIFHLTPKKEVKIYTFPRLAPDILELKIDSNEFEKIVETYYEKLRDGEIGELRIELKGEGNLDFLLPKNWKIKREKNLLFIEVENEMVKKSMTFLISSSNPSHYLKKVEERVEKEGILLDEKIKAEIEKKIKKEI